MKKSKDESEDDIDALFRVPLAEFTGARNALVAQLKKNGRVDQAALVKALGKPPVSAWAVNQLYWSHRKAFDKLIASGDHFHKAQASRSGGKVAEMRAALEARREVLTQLSGIAASVLKDAGHNPSPDTIHRITTTLEGISAYTSHDDGPRLGRLTQDVDPPGFESVGSFVPVAGGKQKAAGEKQKAATTKRAPDDKRQVDEARKEKVATAKASLQDAKRSLAEAQTRMRSLEAAKTRVQADLKQAELRLKEATQRAKRVEEDSKDAAKEVRDLERKVEQASEEFQSHR